MKVTLLATCVTCQGSIALKNAAIAEGYDVTVEKIMKSDERTAKSAELGIGLPVLVREDDKYSDDGKEWIGDEPKFRTKITNPVEEVIDDADTNLFE